MESTYQASVTNFVEYLEKENEGKPIELQEHFFDQNNDYVSPEIVIDKIDGNTAKLKKETPKFYSIIVSPSAKELKYINNDSQKLRSYIREIMNTYADNFYRDKKIMVNDLLYFAKIEHERSFKGFDKEIKENAPFRKQIAKLEHDIVRIRNRELSGSIDKVKKEIEHLKEMAPHKFGGKLITAGMKKEGLQTHIHIIISRKDITNTFGLSPGAKHKESETILNGKVVKSGFNRDQFYLDAEKTFDKLFDYNRNFVEKYHSRKMFIANPKLFFASLMSLPLNEKQVAFKMLRQSGVFIPSVPTSSVQLAYKAFKMLKRNLEMAIKSGAIEI